MDQMFEHWTERWISTASSFIVDVSDLRHELESRDKLRIAEMVYDHLLLACTDFLDFVTGKVQDNTSEGICYNRLLPLPIQSLASQVRDEVINLLNTSFYMGVMTQLFLFDFPTRDKIPSVEIDSIIPGWRLDAIVASNVVGKMPPVINDIAERHFRESVEPFLKKSFSVGILRMGRHKAFHREVFYAGLLLVMECDMASKRI